MSKLVNRATLGCVFALSLVAIPAVVAGQALPTPRRFVDNLDVRCYQIPNQPAINVALRLDHLNPVLVGMQLPFENVILQQPQDLCVPVQKNSSVVPSNTLPFIQYVDWKCYGITGPPINVPLTLTYLNPVINQTLGTTPIHVTVREPQQLCVPVQKSNAAPPPAVLHLVQYLDVKCYRVDSDQHIGGQQIRLTHLNPVLTTLPVDTATFVGPGPLQLCVPVEKNQQPPATDVFQHVQYSDVLCYQITAPPLNLNLSLRHLNPVLIAKGLPVENVFIGNTDKLCVPVAKNGMLPPGNP